MYKYVYDVLLTARKNECDDLVVDALPMLLSDARTGGGTFVDQSTDLAALQADYEALVAAEADLRGFISRHYGRLIPAFLEKDKEAFQRVVAALEAEDRAGAGAGV